ncbi:MAG: transketolase [Candidatus Aceula meridiana]|nr:transketolase [Candidatus Aceula meridiana]
MINRDFENYLDSHLFALKIRIKSLQMVHAAKSSHIGGALSVADLLAVLYSRVLNIDPKNPLWDARDRLIFSKGHACASLYAALSYRGFFPEEELEGFGQDGSYFLTHSDRKVPGVEFSTGSLGHGLPFACGMALAAKRKGKNWRVFVILSDGEMEEGSNWEAFLFAAHHRLDNLIAVIDYNKMQALGQVSDILGLEPLGEKLKSFRWSVRDIDGHDHDQIYKSLSSAPWHKGSPSCLIANTVKGKGVDFMENKLEWHYRSPNAQQLDLAIAKLKKGSHA